MSICCTYAQQILTDNSLSPQQLIQNIVGGDCATATNISSPVNGNVNNIVSYGSFNRGTSDFPLESGIILSTGSVNSAGNTFIGDNLSEGDLNWQTDQDIFDLLGIDQTLNATSITFDLVSANNFIAFKYLFASDEYQQEYPCTFRDVFAILIKRAGTNDPFVNIAIVPDTTTEVSTNTIRPEINGFCEALNEAYFEGYNIGNTNFNGHTTLLTASTEIIPGETYNIKFVIADHIDQRFDSAVFIEAESFGGAIDLGPDQSVCGSNLTLDTQVDNPLAIHTWFRDGAPIVGENSPTLQVGVSGTYSVEISIPIPGGSCVLEDSIDIEVIPFQPAAPIEDLVICDPAPSDGIFDFDFPTLKNDEILSELPSDDYLISYHLSQDDAQNNIDPITGIYQNSVQEETIFVRIESLNGDCLQLGSFNTIVNNSPNTQDYTLDICNDFIADSTITHPGMFDILMADSELDRSVTYYMNENDAIDLINPIEDFPDFSSQPPYIVARVDVTDGSSDCFSLTYINFNYLEPFDLGIDRLVLDACIDPDYEEFEGTTLYTYNTLPVSFDIESYFEYIETTLFPGSSVRTLELYGLGNPRTLTLTNLSSFTMRLGISFENGNCYTEIPLISHKNVLYNVIGNDRAFALCDDSSNDGMEDFNLEDIAAELKDGYDIDLDFYLTEEDRQNNVIPIDQTVPFTVTNTQTLFISSSHDGCSFDTEITLTVNPALNLPVYTLDYCGTTDPDTNATIVILETISNTIIEDISINLGVTANVTYYSTAQDAENQENEVVNTFDLPQGQDLVIRVTNVDTGCFDISTVQLNITPALEASDPEPIIICDEDQNLSATVNLESVLDGLTDNSDDINFTFHESFDDAISEFHDFLSIPNPSSYITTSREVFIRAELESESCFTIFNFEVQVYADPQLGDIPSFVSCSSDPNDPSDFLFEDRDEQIINGQEGMQVLYFESEVEAINRENPIDKTTPYQNTSNPQTIFVRLENVSGNSCFKVSPMQIEVRQNPVYTVPTDIFECGSVITDLSTKVSEIEMGSPTDLNISFHLSPLDASLGTDAIPLDYTATSNPEFIYARIENIASGCALVESFSINTLSLPEVNFGQSLEGCGNNSETSLQWNLTDVELDILDGRQYNIDFTYYPTQDDAEADTNAIVNPETYTNIEGQDSIFVRVRNVSTGCFSIVPFNLNITPPPSINEIETYDVCDTIDDTIDLSQIDAVLVDDLSNVIVTYHSSLVEAEANVNPLDTNFTYNSPSENLFVRVTFITTGCYSTHAFRLVVNPLPIANQPDDLVACDDDFDGILEVDLSVQNTAILGGQNPLNFDITYYNSEQDANNGMSPLDIDYFAFDSEVIFTRIEHNTTGCYATTQFSVIIHPLPIVDIENQVICLDNLPLVVSANTNHPTDQYLWSTGETIPEIEITEVGTYWVTVTTEFGCQDTRVFDVSESESAVIDVVETIDFSDPNNIIMTVSGIGDYLYQLNDLPVQTSNVFINVPLGYNTVTIIDGNGCAEVTREVLVIDAPKHMTPNGDGDFDTWHIVGIETLPGTVIRIFDRYGKVLKELRHNTFGWDGTVNGNKMPAGDYWYVADVVQNGRRFQIKGHFALRR
ncbi:choice-of-anchor L domain-containing protein [Winogradskyella sp.]|uniref:choice-of-anchor L domain-containing protein n=1 Tax=Winogradskyella sp. TaxID=1883156 RepID=UPI003BAC6DE6